MYLKFVDFLKNLSQACDVEVMIRICFKVLELCSDIHIFSKKVEDREAIRKMYCFSVVFSSISILF
jgi:hypothetical protein